MKKSVLKSFTKSTGKHMCQSLFINKVAGLRPANLLIERLWHRCFLVNFVKFLRTPFFIEDIWRLLLYLKESICKASYQHLNPIQDCSPYQFFLYELSKLRNWSSKHSEFKFQSFCQTAVKFQDHAQCQSQINELEQKKWFFWSNPYKREVTITSFIEMLQFTQLWSHEYDCSIV